ncbi:MAG: hypothetical protein NTX56_10320 [Proteobacteria bacterium]|nr:hypothetical protein [Pseudomonadota bacterium]
MLRLGDRGKGLCRESGDGFFAGDRRRAALSLVGIGTNLAFLADILRRPEFAEPLSTRFLERVFPGGWRMAMDENDIETAAAAVSCALDADADTSAVSPWQALGAWRVLAHAGHCGKTALLLQDESGSEQRIMLSGTAGQYRVELFNSEIQVYARSMGGNELFLEIAGAARSYQVMMAPEQVTLSSPGRYRVWHRVSRWRRALADAGSAGSAATQIVASMPGTGDILVDISTEDAA